MAFAYGMASPTARTGTITKDTQYPAAHPVGSGRSTWLLVFRMFTASPLTD